jgi:hypothetical protein
MIEVQFIGTRPEGTQGKVRGWALFRCNHCGNLVERDRNNGQRAMSCGCLTNWGTRKHGESRTKLYGIWGTMLWRCRKPTTYYGSRGITVCKAWHSYESFRKWALAHGYQEGRYIDRINNNGNYTPSNCRWVTPQQSASNRRSRWRH